MSLLTLERWVKGIEYADLWRLLADFRRQLEHENDGRPLHQVETSAALFLYDLCNFCGLDATHRQKVLGKSAAYVESVLDQRFSLPLTVKH